MFIQLGVGEYARVIRTVLEVSESSTDSAQPLSIRLVDEILTWVEGYSTHADYLRLRALVLAAVLR